MYLRSAEIRNYLSLQHIALTGLGSLNTIIGRNNSGKSAVFGALSFLGRVINNHVLGREEPDLIALLTARNPDVALEIRLGFDLRQREREEFVSLLTGDPQRQQLLLGGPFLRGVEYLFRSQPGAPKMLHLRETRVRAGDGKWAVTQRMKADADVIVNNPLNSLKLISQAYSKDKSGIFGAEQLSVDHGDAEDMHVQYVRSGYSSVRAGAHLLRHDGRPHAVVVPEPARQVLRGQLLLHSLPP